VPVVGVDDPQSAVGHAKGEKTSGWVGRDFLGCDLACRHVVGVVGGMRTVADWDATR
jgi:hypothetical protein